MADTPTEVDDGDEILETAKPTAPKRAGLTALQRFVDLTARGQHREALLAASQACHEAPDLAEAHYAYGQAWLALSEPARAEQAFAAALQLKPRWADAWINYGLARYRQSAIADASTAMRQALLAQPGHPVARANLGAFLRLTGDGEAAEALLRDTLRRDADNVGARLNLVADLLQEERPAEALALLNEASPRTDDARAARHWHLQRALALLQLARPGDARAALADLVALGSLPPDVAPLWHWRQVLLALAEGEAARARAAATDMEATLGDMGPDAVLEHQIMARYDLAKFWSGQGDHGTAFAQWQAGHALLKPFQPFSREAHRAVIDATIAAFSPARFMGPRARNTDPAPVFIVGMPRSGTTLCEQIIAAHPMAHGAGERSALGHAAHLLGDGGDAAAVARLAELDAARLEAEAAAYLSDLHALAPGHARIVDKMPGNFVHLGLAGLMLPGAKIIHCVRDPRDIGLSIFTFRFHGAHGYAHDLADLGWAIAEQERLMAHWKAALPHPILTVALSDWVEDFDGTLARVLDHIGLPYDAACARFHEAESRVRTVSRAQVRQPVNARGLGRWRTYEAELAPLIEELDRAGCLEAWRTPPSAAAAVERSGIAAFLPDAARAAAIDARARAALADSLVAVFAACDEHLRWNRDAEADLLASLPRHPVPPAAFAVYAKLIEALSADDAPEAQRCLDMLLRPALRQPATPRVVTLRADDLGDALPDLYRHFIDDDPALRLSLRPLDPPALARATALVADTLALLDRAAPALAGEIRGMAHEIVMLDGDPQAPGEGVFDGATTFYLWGGLALNGRRMRDRATLAEALAHEAGHAYLLGATLGAPMVDNDPAERFASPLRADPRPMDGLVHASFVLARMIWCQGALLACGALDAAEAQAVTAARATNRAHFAACEPLIAEHARFTDQGATLWHAARAWIRAN